MRKWCLRGRCWSWSLALIATSGFCAAVAGGATHDPPGYVKPAKPGATKPDKPTHPKDCEKPAKPGDRPKPDPVPTPEPEPPPKPVPPPEPPPEIPGPLDSIPVPLPKHLADFIRDRDAALVLGKALFWDMQVGSDAHTACATCHFHAGADVRTRNSLGLNKSGTGALRGANVVLRPDDFPFHRLADVFDRDSAVIFDTQEIAGSQGVIRTEFLGVVERRPQDLTRVVPDPVFQVNGVNVRRVEPRNANTVINAVFNDRQFWDGRANRFFNGVNPFGDQDPNAVVFLCKREVAYPVRILIDNASLASQAVGPPLSDFEMSAAGRSFPDLGRKMLSLRPLALQRVHPEDSVLGPFVDRYRKGLKFPNYAALIREAFQPEWWCAYDTIDGTDFTQMEANFSLFWGLSIMLYEATLVSDDSPFDRFRKGDDKALSDDQKEGLQIFMNEGRCVACHKGPEFTGATVSHIRPVGSDPEQIEFMEMQIGPEAFYDNGFYNIGVRPTEEDIGVGGAGPFGPFSFTRRVQQGEDLGFNVQFIPPDHRVAVDGAFKTPTLRNIELTGPYMHNGGMSTLQQVVQFYARGTDFFDHNIDNLDPDVDGIPELRDKPERVAKLVAFLKSLTDDRVRFQRAPFDHPEIVVPDGHVGFHCEVALDNDVLVHATGAGGGARLKSFEDILAIVPNGPPEMPKPNPTPYGGAGIRVYNNLPAPIRY